MIHPSMAHHRTDVINNQITMHLFTKHAHKTIAVGDVAFTVYIGSSSKCSAALYFGKQHYIIYNLSFFSATVSGNLGRYSDAVKNSWLNYWNIYITIVEILLQLSFSS